MVKKSKKLVSLILSILMIFSMVSVAFAADTATNISVEIVSFMRGSKTDLRSSELLEARVSGYDGNVRELTYKWYNGLGTYLYVYNSHNMYNINNTDGEIEIYNKNKNMDTVGNMEEGRYFANSFAGQGYAWASVYGASIDSTKLSGTVTVEVYDQNGNMLCSDSHSKFSTYNLADDMHNVVIGLFVGDKRNVKDLLGESAIVHITCTASSVSNGSVVSGGDYITLEKNRTDGNYYITGKATSDTINHNGDAVVSLTIKKGNCKFHNNKTGTANTTVFVFKKPTTTTTTTTLTLVDNLDDRCEYFIGGVKGTKQDDGTIIFTNLTPNTKYTVEVRGQYEYADGTGAKTNKYAYAYVYDTTKPVYKATVNTYLDGELTDISDIHSEDVTLYLHEDKENAEYIPLTKENTGVYTAAVENGIFYPWHIEAGDHYHQAREYKLIIQNANGELNLHHYSVNYDTNGGAFKKGENIEKEVFSSGVAVTATDNVPVRKGYAFVGWEYNGEIYTAGSEVTSNISAPITLKALWEKEVTVKINVTIDHKVDGGYDYNENRDELEVGFLEQTKDSPAFVETGDKLFFAKEEVTDELGNKKDYTYDTETAVDGKTVLKTIYTANVPTYEGLLRSSFFGVALSKSGYDVGTIEKIQDEDGNWTINIPLTYNPSDFDLEFSVKMDEDVPKELYPDAVIIKIACWDPEANEWVIITQQRTTENTIRPGVRVDIDSLTGEGKGSYPVWKSDSNNNPYGYRAVVAGFIYDNSTIIVPTERDHIKNDGSVIISYTDGNYTATMGDISDGMLYSQSLYGAYYNEVKDAQQGTLDGVITVEKYDVTFDAKGGTVNGKKADVAEQQYYIPAFENYQPVMEGHNFLGWYKDEKCTIPANEGELLTEDITLYAKWDRVLTGNLIVDGYYNDKDNIQHAVALEDRATDALVELKEITNDGEYNIAGQSVKITWSNDKHFSIPVDYRFAGLNPDKTYRIDVYLVNYDAAYQNSTTIINGNGDIYDDYFPEDYVAVYPADSVETFVNTFMHFNPEVYFQNVEVDATKISEDFRPTEALVEYFGKEAGTEDDYNIIVQHTVEPFGVKVGMDKITGLNDGTYGIEIWKKIFNGNLYDYQANLTKLDSKPIDEWPVIIDYGESVRWSPYSQAPTAPLKVVIIPRWYSVNYNWNGVKDEAGNDIVYSVSRGHVWSFESAIDYSEANIPSRTGYNFLGWYADSECTGEKITTIAADVHSDTTVYAKWEAISDRVLTVEHIDKNTGKHIETEIIESQTFGDTVYATELVKDFEYYTYDSASAESVIISEDNTSNVIILYYRPYEYTYTVNYLENGTNKVLFDSKTVENIIHGTIVSETAEVLNGYSVVNESTQFVTIDADNKVINFYYEVDETGGGDIGEEPDGIPDIYQKKIIFKVVNGTWSDGTTADIVKVVNLMKDGEYDINGTADIVIPVGMRANHGFKNGEWKDAIPVETVSGTNTEIYTYAFDRSTTPIEPKFVSYIVEYYKADGDEYIRVDDDTQILTGNIGDKVNAEIKTYDGYALNEIRSTLSGILKVIATQDDILVLKLYYDADTMGDSEEPDGIPDIYQKKIIFKVVNGTWSDGTTADIVKVVNLMKDGEYDINGTADIVIPVGMRANNGFKNGEWKDAVPVETVSGTNTEIYTYAFDRSTTPIEPIEPTTVRYFVEYYKADSDREYIKVDADTEVLVGNINDKVTATAKTYDGYVFNADISTVEGILKAVTSDDDIVTLKLYYDKISSDDGNGDGNGDIPGGNGSGNSNIKHHILFGKTDGIGWYKVSKDGGKTFDTVFGNSTYEVEQGTEIIVRVGDLMGNAFTFYVNGKAIEPDENGNLVITVNGYMLIGALGYDIDIPDIEESLNWFQRIIKKIKDFFAWLFGKKK